MVQFLSPELCLVGVGIACFQPLLLQRDSIEKPDRRTVQIQSRELGALSICNACTDNVALYWVEQQRTVKGFDRKGLAEKLNW